MESSTTQKVRGGRRHHPNRAGGESSTTQQEVGRKHLHPTEQAGKRSLLLVHAVTDPGLHGGGGCALLLPLSFWVWWLFVSLVVAGASFSSPPEDGGRVERERREVGGRLEGEEREAEGRGVLSTGPSCLRALLPSFLLLAAFPLLRVGLPRASGPVG